MSYLTLKVEIDHGKVTTKDPSKLPEKAIGLLTIFPAELSTQPSVSPIEALEALQKHLALDAAQASAWMTTVREGRR